MDSMDNCEDSSCYRVLSIQSHVVSGYVGNKSAIFPLQVLGFEVDSINSVQLSNHTGYKYFKGENLDADDLHNIFEGLKLNNLTSYSHVLTGYVRTEKFLLKLIDIIKELKRLNPSLYYVCDPVMGDNGRMYVPEELLPIYRDNVLPLADVITPNQYEAERLTGIVIKTEKDVLETMDAFHKRGIKIVVLSSAVLEGSDKLELFGSSIKGETRSLISMEIPKLPASFTGTGDLFSALFLAWMAKTKGNLKISCENVVNTISCILKRTLEMANGAVDPGKIELKIIQSKTDIENPPTVLKSCTLKVSEYFF